MKNATVAMLLVAVLLFGCIGPQIPEGNQTTQNLTGYNASNVSAPGTVFAISSVNGVFETKDYGFSDNSNPFSDGAGGNLGKTSTAFIKIDDSNLNFLSGSCSNEKQAFWIHPMAGNETGTAMGVIFNAVYTVDLSGDCPQIRFLGKDYALTLVSKPQLGGDRIVRGGDIRLREISSDKIIALKDGSSFNNDDRWKVVLGWKDGKLAKIIIYMEGYFYDIGENEEIDLFGIDNGVIAKFEDLGSEPKMKLITADLTEVEPAQPSSVKEPEEQTQPLADFEGNFTIDAPHAGRSYGMHEIMNESGIYLEFEPEIPLCVYCSPDDPYYNYDHLSEAHRLEMPISDKTYVVSCLRINESENNSKICFANEKQHAYLPPPGCENNFINLSEYVYYIDISGKRYAFWGLHDEVEFCELAPDDSCENLFTIGRNGEVILPEGDILHLWIAAPGYTWCASWVEISHFTDVIEMENGIDGIELSWTEKTPSIHEEELIEIVNGTAVHRIGTRELDIPGLKSIFIPANSSAYGKLVGTK